jgi:hypothetical protein
VHTEVSDSPIDHCFLVYVTGHAKRVANSEQFRSKPGQNHTNGIERRRVAYRKSPTNPGCEREADAGGLRAEGKVGDPEMSYFGEVTARALSKVYPTYKSRTHILYAPHTEDILDLIRSGKADVGVVYRANVINSGEVRISDEIPLGRDLQIQFGQAVVSTCRASLRTVAEQFSDFTMTPLGAKA